MLHPKENNVLYCVQDVVFVFAKLQDGALRSGFSCNFAAIHLLPSPRRRHSLSETVVSRQREWT